jgi:CRP/FNR family transcriptional regulator
MIQAEELRSVSAALAALPMATLDRIVGAAEERRVGRGRTLYRAGDAVDGLYIILSGRVRVSRETAERVELLHNEKAGGVLGEIPVFSGTPFPATATALEATRCAHLPRVAVMRLIHEDSAFVSFAMARLAERARVLLHRIDELTAMTVGARVAAHVLQRAGQSGAPFTLGMSQESLANELGTAREVVVRALRSLIAAGAIERAGRSRFVVRSLTVLRALASSSAAR